MKLLNTKIIFAVFIIFGLAACSSDDDAGPSLSPEDVLPGTWEPIAFSSTAESEFEGIFNGSSTVTSEGRDFKGQITFTENPREFTSNIGYTLDMTIETSIEGIPVDTENQTLVVEQEEATGTWSINEDGKLVGLYVNAPEAEAEEWEYDVEIISSNQIILRGKQQYTHSEQGITSVIDAEVEVTLMRVN